MSSLKRDFAPLMQELQDLLVDCPDEVRGGALHSSLHALNQQMHQLMAEEETLAAEEGEEAAAFHAITRFPRLLTALSPKALGELDELDDGPSATTAFAELLKDLKF